MITRIVKLEFQPERLEDFLRYFDSISHVVNDFPGCIGMKLYQDVEQRHIVMTYSHWNSPEDLENYRCSEAFGKIWPTIKPWFAQRPEAWTVNAYFNGFEARAGE